MHSIVSAALTKLRTQPFFMNNQGPQSFEIFVTPDGTLAETSVENKIIIEERCSLVLFLTCVKAV